MTEGLKPLRRGESPQRGALDGHPQIRGSPKGTEMRFGEVGDRDGELCPLLTGPLSRRRPGLTNHPDTRVSGHPGREALLTQEP